jgi:hypothetical protein
MIVNEFIPLSISSFHSYLLEKFNIDINNIPENDWTKLVCKSYCKNIINSKYCFKKIKKVNSNNINICSKCCEKLKLKTYKRNKVQKCKKNNDIDNNEDSGFFTETDNELYTIPKIISSENMTTKLNSKIDLSCNINNISKKEDCKNKEYIKFGDLDFKLNNKSLYLIDILHKNSITENNVRKHINNINDNICFGSLKFKIDEKNNKTLYHDDINKNISENKICNIKLKKRVLLKINIL